MPDAQRASHAMLARRRKTCVTTQLLAINLPSVVGKRVALDGVMPRFPIEYEVTLQKSSTTAMELHAGHRPAIFAGPPPEFGGTDTWWSPEHLLVSAAATCFVATFVATAERASLRVGRLQCHATGTLDRTKEGVAFTSVDLAVTLSVVVDDVERARKLVDEAKRHCFVANSLRCPVNVSADITPS